MEDINQIHGSTQTNDFLKLGSSEYRDEIADKIGIKDFFPKTKKILAHKNHKNQLEPLELLNKFRKKLFGVCDFQKKLSFKAKNSQKKHLELQSNCSNNWTLDVKNVSQLPKSDNNINNKSSFLNSGSEMHSFFPKTKYKFSSDSSSLKPKKTAFITTDDEFSNRSKANKQLFFNKAKDEAPDNETVYSSYVLKDFASPNKNELEINLNYNTFYALFDKERKFLKDQSRNSKSVALFEKEKKLMNKIERRIQTEFLQKISFPPNEKFMNKTINNFNFNKGLFKINDLRGSHTPADKIRSLVSVDKDQAAKSSLSPSSNAAINDLNTNTNTNNTAFNFANKKKLSNDNNLNIFTAENFNTNKFNFTTNNNFNKFNSNISSNNNSNKNIFGNLNLTINKNKRKSTSEAALLRRNDYYSKNNYVFDDLDKLYNKKFLMENAEEEVELPSRPRITSPKMEFNTCELSDNYNNNLEKKLYTFNLHQGANAHVLHMLRINQKHEKLGLTKRTKLGPSNGLNEKLLKQKLQNNMDVIVKRHQQQNFHSKKGNQFANYNDGGMKLNINFSAINMDKSKFLKINKNLFNSKEIPNEEKKYYELKKDKDATENSCNNYNFNRKNNNNAANNTNINNNIVFRQSDLNRSSDLKNLEKYSINLDNTNKNEFLYDNSSVNNNCINNDNNEFAEKIEALNAEYEENKSNINKNNKSTNSEEELKGKNVSQSISHEPHELNTAEDRESEGILFEEKSKSIKNESKENTELLSSPHTSMEKIISKKTFENFYNNLNNNKVTLENSATGNEDAGNSYKRNIVLKGKQSSSKTGFTTLNKNVNINLGGNVIVDNSNSNSNNKIGKGNKTTLLQRQPNNHDIGKLQAEGC